MLFTFDKKIRRLLLSAAVIIAAAFFVVPWSRAFASENDSAAGTASRSTVSTKKKSLTISSFKVEGDLTEVDTGVTQSAIDGSMFTASWKLKGFKDDGKTEVAIYADTDNKGFDGDLVYDGKGKKSDTAFFAADELATDDYYFYIVVTRNGKTARKYTDKSYPIVNEEDIMPTCSVTFYLTGSITNVDVLAADVNFEEGCSVSVKVNDDTVIEPSNAIGRYNIPLSEGDNNIDLVVTGANGKEKHFTENVTLDTDPPSLDVYTDIDGAVTSADTVDINGLVENTADLRVNGKSVTYDENGNFSTTVSLSTGMNIIEVKATDMAGNVNDIPMKVYRRQIHKNKRNKKAAIFVGALFGIIIFGYIFFFIKWIIRHRRLDKKKKSK